MLIDDLKMLSIYELRAKAREVGVKAPTTKNAGQLIEEIIAINDGKLKPTKSNMGRPPKMQKANELQDYLLESDLYKNAYEIQQRRESGYCLRNDDNPQNLIKMTTDYMGIVREYKGQKFVKNYLRDDAYCVFSEEQQNLVEVGDFIIGKCVREDFLCDIVSIEKIEFNKSNNKGKAYVVNCKDEFDMRKYVSKQAGIKIVVEIEAPLNEIRKQNKDEFYFSTKECDDIKDSYNLLLDIKQLVNRLCEKNMEFSLYFIDVEYVYSILSMYYHFKNQLADLNSGQYFKEILSTIKNSNGATVTLFEKDLGKKSSYFDIILNKYCEKNN